TRASSGDVTRCLSWCGADPRRRGPLILGGNNLLVSGRVGGRGLTRAALILSTLGPIARPVLAAVGDVGYEDGSYNGSTPTGREPQSKLWFNDGIWWASMITSNGNNDIHRLNW